MWYHDLCDLLHVWLPARLKVTNSEHRFVPHTCWAVGLTMLDMRRACNNSAVCQLAVCMLQASPKLVDLGMHRQMPREVTRKRA